MRVTIIADASRDPATGASGYGGWIACDRGRRKVGGAFRAPTDSIAGAEMAAIVNVVHAARKRGLLVDGDVLLVRTDCLDAIWTLEGRRPPQTNDERMAEAAFLDVIVGVSVTLKHVKGHTRGRTAATASNNYCDEEAKRHMRAMRTRSAHPSCSVCMDFPREGDAVCSGCLGFPRHKEQQCHPG